MRPVDLVRLVALAAIWGASFIFIRVVAPSLGPVLTAELRVLIAGIALAVYFHFTGYDPEWKRHGRFYFAVGALNSALPFLLYSFAALHIPASYSVILNATTPMFGALAAAVWLNERLTLRKLLGLLLGVAGVALISRPPADVHSALFSWAIAACLLAAICYALSGVYVKKRSGGATPMGIAAGSQIAAAVVLAPLVPVSLPPSAPSALVWANMVTLAVLCSAVAYLLYYRLIADVGPTRALTVTFLMPLFGMVWGSLFLGEVITPMMVLGCGLIVAGTVLVVRTT